MARTVQTVLPVNRTALRATATPPAGDVTNGNACLNDGATWLEVTNSDAAPHNLTVVVTSGVDGLTAGPRAYVIPVSAAVQKVGPFPLQWYSETLLYNVDNALLKVQPYTALGP